MIRCFSRYDSAAYRRLFEQALSLDVMKYAYACYVEKETTSSSRSTAHLHRIFLIRFYQKFCTNNFANFKGHETNQVFIKAVEKLIDILSTISY